MIEVVVIEDSYYNEVSLRRSSNAIPISELLGGSERDRRHRPRPVIPALGDRHGHEPPRPRWLGCDKTSQSSGARDRHYWHVCSG